MPDTNERINQLEKDAAVQNVILHSLTEHIKKEEQQFQRIENKIEEISEKLDNRLGQTEKTLVRHGVYFKLLGAVLGSSTVISILFGLL